VLRYGHQEQKDGQDDQASLDSSDSVIQLQLYLQPFKKQQQQQQQQPILTCWSNLSLQQFP
jgi:hypothetical protein